jgi:hypothetical protein
MSEQTPDDTNSNQHPTKTDYKDWRREKRHHSPMHGLFWGMLLILLGVLLFLNAHGHLDDDRWWQYFLIGLGAIFILDGLIHYMRKISYGILGRLIAGAVLIVVGLSLINNWDNWWPIILIAAGVAILLGYFIRRH